ncbi:MAG: hypothetical protein KTR25_16770 [Myxococcales bacterium]|nr:hypothetical protein [Myxococcales bacterium]
MTVVLTTALGLCFFRCSPASRPNTTTHPDPHPLPQVVQGANLRPVGDTRRGYGTRTARNTMKRLQALGVNTIGVLFNGRMISAESTNVFAPPQHELHAIRRGLNDARSMGFATVLVPHIYIDDGTWRGEITFTNASHEKAWWNSYEAFIETAASTAQSTGTSVLSIGVELKGLSRKSSVRDHIAPVIQRIRSIYKGLLTYSANWDEAEGVQFWDLLDITGVNGYYPLAPTPKLGAQQIAQRLRKLAVQTNRDVLVTEVGYRSSPQSYLRPWEWPDQIANVVDEHAQAEAWSAVLGQWMTTPGIRGVIIWVIPTDPDDPASEPKHGFNPFNKEAETIIKHRFQSGRTRPLPVDQRVETTQPSPAS